MKQMDVLKHICITLIDTSVNAPIVAFVNEHNKVKFVLVLVRSAYAEEEFDPYTLVKMFCTLLPLV